VLDQTSDRAGGPAYRPMLNWAVSAAVLAAVLDSPNTIGQTLDGIGGDTPMAADVKANSRVQRRAASHAGLAVM
jgi:hypothetical protein